MGKKRAGPVSGQIDRMLSDAASYPTADEIAERAHALFITGGRRIACIPEYWRTAEAELLDRAARRVLRTPRQR
jgi:hypothetical protein